eukprot:TRINITY_DN33473_c0_g1_i1.p1 TRINITY_DN33473_c0_g1~~TRINITY_DN33473_c0_g1_i1.p1  ORF type:complete len:558 (+),score=179.76 TRINITY_DN33473_c0_g1_i1:155-1828(+)
MESDQDLSICVYEDDSSRHDTHHDDPGDLPQVALPSSEWVRQLGSQVVTVHTALHCLELERAGLCGREEIATEEATAAFSAGEDFSRRAVDVEALDELHPLLWSWASMGRACIALNEEEEWNVFASRFLQIGIPRRHIALPGAVVRSSPTVDARRTMRQMREGQLVVVEEVAGNWARISSPVKGWVWRTHLCAHPDAGGCIDESPPRSPAITPGSLTSAAEFTPGASSELPFLADTASDALSYTTDANDADSFACTARGPRQFGSGTGFSRCTQSDTDYKSCNSTAVTTDTLARTSQAKALSPGDRVRMRDNTDSYWAAGEVCRIDTGRVLVRRDGFAGLSTWRFLLRAEPAKAREKGQPILVVVERHGKDEALGLDLNHQTLEVRGVDEGSPANYAGMRVGMRLVSVQGMPVSSMRDIRTLLRTAGDRVTLGVAQGSVPAAEEERVVSQFAAAQSSDGDQDASTTGCGSTSSGVVMQPPSGLREGTLRGAQMLHLRAESASTSTFTYTRIDGYAALATPHPPKATQLLLISARAAALGSPLATYGIYQTLAQFIDG